jgi:hypothetical protein
MQTNPYYVGFFAIAVVCGTLVWFLLWDREKKGRALKRQISRGEIPEPAGRGSWYARNINRTLTKMLYTIGHFVLTLLSIILVLLVLVPTDFHYTLNLAFQALPIFIILGICTGLPGPEANPHLTNSSIPEEE